MKKKLFFTILCLGLLLPIGAKAEDTQSETATVGNVETPVYEMTINWNYLEFDWVYNSNTKSFEWKAGTICTFRPVQTQEEFEKYKDNIYTDLECETPATEYTGSSTQYFTLFERDKARITITDESTNGQIIPSITWKSEDKYADTNAKFQYEVEKCVSVNKQEIYDLVLENKHTLYTDSNCTEAATTVSEYESGKYYVYEYTQKELTTEEIPDEGRINATLKLFETDCLNGACYHEKRDEAETKYLLSVNLTGGTITPTPGDEIGTVTVKIKADE